MYAIQFVLTQLIVNNFFYQILKIQIFVYSFLFLRILLKFYNKIAQYQGKYLL